MANAMIARQRAAEQKGAQIGERFGEQLAADLMQIALHRQGWGYDRIRKLLDEMHELSEYYDPAFNVNPEQEVWQERMDAELQDMIKGKAEFYTFEQRYPMVNQIRWKTQRGVTPIEHGK